jgi:dihydrofolate synthase/folylpolyglutamate synthase
MEFLGDSLGKIANEKAGIIKPGVAVVIGEWNNETLPVFESKARLENSKIALAQAAPENWVNAFELKGNYQRKNLATVSTAIKELQLMNFTFDDSKILYALQNVKTLSGIQGRWEILQQIPLVIADVAHNDHGLKPVLEQFTSLPHGKMHFVLGFVNDKDLSKVLPLFPQNAAYYFCKPNIIRGLNEKELANIAITHGLKGLVYTSVSAALEAAKSAANATDIVYVGGSTFVVAEVIDG